MTISVWFSLFAICLLGAMSPGPSLLTVSKHTLANGRKNGLAAAWAHAFGIGIYALITIVGLAAVLQQSPIIFIIISYIGAAYLAYLGFNALRSKGGVADRLEAGDSVSVWTSAREGFLISILSPKIALFFIALFSQFVALGNQTVNQFIIVVTPLMVDGLWYSLITFFLSIPLVIDKIRQKAVLIDRISGLILIALSIRVLWVV